MRRWRKKGIGGLALILLGAFGLVAVVNSPVWAGHKEVDRFNSGSFPRWTFNPSGIGSTSQDQVATPDKATTTNYYSLKITGNGTATYTYADPHGDDWLTPGYDDLDFFVYGDDDKNTETLQVVITEYDNLGINEVPERWTWPKTGSSYPIDWKGWRYIRINIKNDANPSGGDGIWNPNIKLTGPPPTRYKGLTKIEFTVGNNAVGVGDNIYIDEIYASGDGTGIKVQMIDPTDDTQNIEIDKIVDRAPPTISAVLSSTADVTNTEIDIVNESNVLQRINATVADDGNTGVFATPDPTYGPAYGSSGQTYTVFIWPNIIDPNLNLGEAQVIRFKVVSPSKKVGTAYNRNVTQ